MDYVEVLENLLRIDTTVPPGRNYEKAVDYLLPLFQDLGFETRKVTIPAEHAEGREGRVNLIAHRRRTGRPRLIIYGHIDVVPAEGWDAFNPRVEDGKVYGRGAADMKGSIVATAAHRRQCLGGKFKAVPYTGGAPSALAAAKKESTSPRATFPRP